jgi:hypothetical protein
MSWIVGGRIGIPIFVCDYNVPVFLTTTFNPVMRMHWKDRCLIKADPFPLTISWTSNEFDDNRFVHPWRWHVREPREG